MMKSMLLLFLIGFVSAAKLPNEWERCKVPASMDHKRNKCVERSMANAIKLLSRNGDKNLGFPRLDPFNMKNVTNGQQDPSNGVDFQQELWNLKLTGLSTIKPNMIHVDGKFSSPQNWSMHTKFDPWNLTIDGMYKINGKLQVVPITGEGKWHCSLDGVTLETWLNGKPQMKNGVEYLKITDTKVDFNIKRFKVNMENLLGGGELGENMNHMLNEKWEASWTQLKPKLDKNLLETYVTLVRKVMEAIPYKDLILDH